MQKQSAFKLSNHGFLLAEHLIALLITSTLLLLLTTLLPIINSYQTNLDEPSFQEISALRTQLQTEAKRATHFTITNNELQIHLASGTTPTYFISNGRLMRQVSGKGGEIALYHCKDLTSILHHDQSVTLTLTTTNNKTHTIYLTSHLPPLELNLNTEEEIIDE